MHLHFLENPKPEDIGNTELEFLRILDGPTAILLEGKDRTRTRAFITLLHGNEPSGIKALFRILKAGIKPAVNMLCIVGNVHAALSEPIFNYRALPGKRDLNRCFKAPFDIDTNGELALEILELLRKHAPEAAIDMHNTSGSGPAFAVATHMDEQHDALATMFTNRMIITDLRLGALFEISEYLCPTVTIECGGREDEEAHAIAYEGLKIYFTCEDALSHPNTEFGMELLHNPVRLELRDDITIEYSDTPGTTSDIALHNNIENLNAGISAAGTELGFINTNKSLSQLFKSVDKHDECVINKLITVEGNKLLLNQNLKLIMVTNNPVIAKMDCLFYASNPDGTEIFS